MPAWSKSYRAAALLRALIAVSGVAVMSGEGPAAAQQPGAAADPSATNLSQVLRDFPKAGAEMIARIRELAANPTNLQSILGLAAGASKDQKSAIGSALGQAAKIALRRDAAYANQVQVAVAASGDTDLTNAFLAVIGDTQIGGVGGGGGAGGGGGGGGGQTNPLGGPVGGFGTAQAIGGGGTPTGSFTYSPSVSGSSPNNNNNNNPVSP
jgi:hypothetical protein